MTVALVRMRELAAPNGLFQGEWNVTRPPETGAYKVGHKQRYITCYESFNGPWAVQAVARLLRCFRRPSSMQVLISNFICPQI